MTRQERKEMFARLKAERRGEQTQQHEREMKQRELERRIAWTDEDAEQLCVMSEIEPNRFATTIQEEVDNARLFAKLLGIPDDAIDPQMNVYDFLEMVFSEWREQGSPLFNPLSQKFSPHFVNRSKKSFPKGWTFLDPATDYKRPLSDFHKTEVVPFGPTEPNDPLAPPSPTADDLSKELRRLNEQSGPLMYYTAKIMPHCDE